MKCVSHSFTVFWVFVLDYHNVQNPITSVILTIDLGIGNDAKVNCLNDKESTRYFKSSMDVNRTRLKEVNVRNDEEVKKTGCWAKFKSLFEERGFDLEFEYNGTSPVNILRENHSENAGNRKLEARNSINKKPEGIVKIDGELSGVINFYEQFATLSEDSKEEVIETKRRSTIKPRVSMRPSILLTNIIEETGDIENESSQEVRMFSTEVKNICKTGFRIKFSFINCFNQNSMIHIM